MWTAGLWPGAPQEAPTACTRVAPSPLRQPTSSPVAGILGYLALANITLGIFNLIPGFPLDGGRVLRSIIWKATGNMQRATTITTFIGQAFAYLFIVYGIWQFFGGNAFRGLFRIRHFVESTKVLLALR